MSAPECLVCGNDSFILWDQDKHRTYLRCNCCELIQVPRGFLLSHQEEKLRYEAHQNSSDDPQYRDYLNRIFIKTKDWLRPGSTGLDFGCGRTHTLCDIFKSHGFSMEAYDLYFHPREDIWEKMYDFIVLSEVIEHLADPLMVMHKLRERLNKQGQFFIKTKFYPTQSDFPGWFYKRDLTHVQFFNPKSMKQLSLQLALSMDDMGDDLTRLGDD